MRIAPSFIRFGSLEILYSNHELSELRRLLNYILKVIYFLCVRFMIGVVGSLLCFVQFLLRAFFFKFQLRPDIKVEEDQKYLSLLKQVIDESIDLVVAWACVGYVSLLFVCSDLHPVYA